MLQHFGLLSIPTNVGTDPTAIANFKKMFDAVISGDPVMVLTQTKDVYTFIYPATVAGDNSVARANFIQGWLSNWMGSPHGLSTDFAATIDDNGTQYYMYPTGPITTRTDHTTEVLFLLVPMS